MLYNGSISFVVDSSYAGLAELKASLALVGSKGPRVLLSCR